MITNNSGKFVSSISNIGTEVTIEEKLETIPPAPGSSILQYVEEYFGRFWWAWLILLLILKMK